MEKETKHYVEYINHDPNWLKTITIEIDKLLVDREYIDFFMQIDMKWVKDNSSTSYLQKFIIPRLPCFEKLAFSQFQLYIEDQTIPHCFVCRNYKKSILIRSAEGKEKVFNFTHVKDTYWFAKVG